MIELDDITMTFADGDERITAIDNATLHVPSGTIAAITGPSGSGKSTLLAVASTLLTPDSGRVRIDGTEVTAGSRADSATLRRERIGIVFQQSNLLPSLTATEQLLVMNELGGRRARAPRRGVEAKAEELLVAVGLIDSRHKRPHQLSGGERQRVNISRALMNDPSVLVIDEPTSALDQERGAEIIDLILKLTLERQTATLLVTHDTSHLSQMDEVRTMIDGVLS